MTFDLILPPAAWSPAHRRSGCERGAAHTTARTGSTWLDSWRPAATRWQVSFELLTGALACPHTQVFRHKSASTNGVFCSSSFQSYSWKLRQRKGTSLHVFNHCYAEGDRHGHVVNQRQTSDQQWDQVMGSGGVVVQEGEIVASYPSYHHCVLEQGP